MTGFGFSDGDDFIVKGDDGSDEGQKIVAKQDGSDYRLGTDTKIRGANNQLIGAIDDAIKTTAEFTSESLVDAFGRLRVSVPTIKHETYFVESDRTILMTKKEVGAGSVVRNATTKEMELSVGTANGDRAAYQSKEYIHYIPGQSTAMEISCRFGSEVTGCVKRFGLFDNDNGLFFELDGSTLYTVVRSKVSGSVVDTKVAQASWSKDSLDGNGPSGQSVDLTKNQILYIDYQWLGSGRVRFGIHIDGEVSICDERFHANLASNIYMQTGSLPVRSEVVNTSATAQATSIYWACSSVYNEGSLDSAVSQHSVNRGTNTININSSSLTPLISLRLKSANNRATIVPDQTTLLSTSNTDVLWEIVLNPTLSGASWVSAGSNSIGEYDISSTSATGGEVIASGYISKQSNESPRIEQSFLKLSSDFDGTPDILSLRARTVTSNANVLASFSFLELF